MRNEIAANAPIGATVTVAAPETLTVNVALKVTDGVGNSDGIKQVLNDYLKKRFLKLTIYHMRILENDFKRICKTGVLDYAKFNR